MNTAGNGPEEIPTVGPKQAALGLGFGWTALTISLAASAATHWENRKEIVALHNLVVENEHALGTTQFALNERLRDLGNERKTIGELQKEIERLRNEDKATVDELNRLKEATAAR